MSFTQVLWTTTKIDQHRVELRTVQSRHPSNRRWLDVAWPTFLPHVLDRLCKYISSLILSAKNLASWCFCAEWSGWLHAPPPTPHKTELLYFTLQDIDTYKSMVRDEINEWMTVLKARNISDWLIVVVVYDESKVKSKLLRTSVVDRVKSDFCSKNSDR